MIIGITGHMRAGKDSVAAILVGDHGFTRVGFADSVKEMALAINPVVAVPNLESYIRLKNIIESVGWEKAKELPEVRRLLQAIGTEAGRGILGEDVWIRAMERKLFPPRGDGVELDNELDFVIPDVRFCNEADAIDSWGGVIWRVDRPGYNGDGHASETELEGIEPQVVITNDGSLADLVPIVDELMTAVIR